MASTGREATSSVRLTARVLALAAGWWLASPAAAQSTEPDKSPLQESANQSRQPGSQPPPGDAAAATTTSTTLAPGTTVPITESAGVKSQPTQNPANRPGETVRPRNRRTTPAGTNQHGQPGASQPGAGQSGTNPPGTNPPGANGLPGNGGGGAVLPANIPAPSAEGPIRFDAFSEPVDLSTIVDYIAKSLGINITVKGTLSGQVVFNAPVEVDRSRLRGLLSALLEQHNFALVYDEDSTFYSIVPSSETTLRMGDTMSSTRVFSTPNVRPSALKQIIDAQLMGGAGPGGGTVMNKISAVDELGVIVATETPRKLDQIGKLIDRMLEEYAKNEYLRIDLRYVAAPTARERALQLVGQASNRPGSFGVDPNQSVVPQQIPGMPGGATGRIDNLADRLTIDPQSNALVFRGLPIEIDQVKRIVEVIDVPNNLVAETYFVGTAAKQIADVARGRGLGEVTQISTRSNNNNYNTFFSGGFDPSQMQNQLRQQGVSSGGPVMVVDEGTGRIYYYGTPEQQTELATLIEQLEIESEQIVIRGYKLKNGDAEQMAELILGLLQNRTPEGEGSPLLPGGNSSIQQQPSFFPQFPVEEGSLSINSENVYVVADKANNQVMVKAPQKQQKEFQKLIESLDLRRPQVYVEAQIVAVTTDDRLRLAFETQLINANGTGGVLNTNFGLSSFAENGSLLDPKTVATGLTGLTAAVIKSDQVPIIINALKRETDSRIISSPQLLANDNEEAEVVSLDEQPVAQVNRGTGGSGDIITAGENAQAGTTLKVTPHISEAGYLRLEYEIELSSFTGEAQDNLPPPKQTNNIKSVVTLPSDSTIVVGGLVLDSNTKTIIKVPLLGDIPIIGELFKDRNQGDRKTTLYIFLRPKILNDPYFADAKLITDGPAKASKLPEELEPLKPESIEIIETDRTRRQSAESGRQ